MHEVQVEDPEQLSMSDLTKGLTPTLKQLGVPQGLAVKSQKDYAKGVAAFLDKGDYERAIPLPGKCRSKSHLRWVPDHAGPRGAQWQRPG